MKIFVTSSLPYCNNICHLGTILTILSGDIYARFKRALGCDVIFLCGTDEYGSATTIKAKKENLTCRELCDKYASAQKKVYDWLNIKFDAWGCTSNPEQTKITHDIFLGLYANGFIEEQKITQLYCETCSMFLADQYVKGFCYNPICAEKSIITNGDQCDCCQHLIDVNKLIKPYCSVCSSTPVQRTSKHLFLKLADLADRVEDYIDNGIKLNQQAMSIAKTWLKSGLKSRCITRDLDWGTPIPQGIDSTLDSYSDKVFYVWFDAPFGYYSILANNRPNWLEWLQSPDLQWVSTQGKDNIPFHTIVFPASIKGSGKSYPLITSICSTNYLLYEGKKFSKSNSIGIFGNQIMDISEKIGLNEDYWRFYLTKIRPENSDSSFGFDDFVSSINADLVNNIGNFVNRCVSLTKKYCGDKTTAHADSKLVSYVEKFCCLMNEFKFKDALKLCLSLSSHGNLYLQTEKPWHLVKTDLVISQQTIGYANATCWILLNLLSPFIPGTCHKILSNIKCNLVSVYHLDQSYPIHIELTGYIVLPFKKIELAEIKSVVN